MKKYASVKKLNVNILIKISILSIIALIFTIINTSLVFFPMFLKLDIGDVPAVIASLSINIYAGIFVELIKNILKFIINNDTGGIGEIANFVVGVSYILPISIIYKKFNNNKSYIIGSIISILTMAFSGALINYFILLPLYARLVGGIDFIIKMVKTNNNLVKDIKSLIIIYIVPFNIVKGTIISILSYLLYKRLGNYINKKKIQN